MKSPHRLLTIGLLGICASSQGAFVILDSFNTESINLPQVPAGGTGVPVDNVPWHGRAGSTANNASGSINSASGYLELINSPGSGLNTQAYYDLGANSIANGTTATVFFRAYVPVNPNEATVTKPYNFFLVLTDQTTNLTTGGGFPSGDFQVQMALTLVSGDKLSIEGRNGSGSPNTVKLGNFATDTWYNFWYVVDSSTNETNIFVEGGAFATQTQIGSGLDFRNILTRPDTALTTFAVVGNTSGSAALSQPIRLDDIHIDTAGANLVNPVPEPSQVALLISACIALFAMRRRK